MLLRILVFLSVSAVALGDAMSQASFTATPSVVYTGMNMTFTDTTPGTIPANLWNVDGQYIGGGCACRTFTVNHTFSTPGPKVVELTVIFNNGGTATSSMTINVQQGVLAHIAPVTTGVLLPASFTFNSSASSTPFPPLVSRQWTFSDGGSATGTTVNRTFTTAATHWAEVLVTDSAGFSDTHRIDFVTYSSLASVEALGATNVCVGGTASVQYTLQGPGPFQITWNDGFTNTVSSPGTYIRNHVPSTTGSLSLTFTAIDGAGGTTVVTGSAAFFVLPQPDATLSIISGMVCSGTSFTVQVNFNSITGPFGITWHDGVTQFSLFTSTFARSFALPSGQHVIGLASAFAGGCVDPTPPVLLLNVPTTVVSLSADTLLSYGEVGSINVGLTGMPPYTVTWSDGVVQNTTGATLQRVVNPEQTSTYTISSIVDGAGCITTALPQGSITLHVAPPPPLAGHAFVAGTDNRLYHIRLSDGMVVSSVPVSVPGFSFTSIRTLVRRPGTEDYYALVLGPSLAAVVALDESTGTGTLVASTTHQLRSLGIDGLGRLIAVSVPAGFVVSQFFVVDPGNGTVTSIGINTLPTNAMRLAYSADTHRLHYLAGNTAPTTKVFLDLDPGNFAVTGSGLFGRDGELNGNIQGFTPANADNLLATIGTEVYALFPRTRSIIRVQTLSVNTTAIAAAGDAFVHLTSSGEDLHLATSVNGVTSDAGRKSVVSGDTLSLAFGSPGGTFGGTQVVVLADLYDTSVGPTFTAPFGISPVYVGASTFLTLESSLLPGAADIIRTITIPPGLTGFTARFQAIVATPFARNGFFASSEGREVLF